MAIERSALVICVFYGTIENLYENTDKLKGKLQEKVITGRDSACLSKTLATINTQMDIELSEKDFQFRPLGEDAKKIFIELGFNNILKKAKFEEVKPKGNLSDIIKITTKQDFKNNLFALNTVSLILNGDLHYDL